MEDNRAVIYADGLYNSADGKTAHGLVRYSRKYDIVGVVDSTLPEGDSGEILDGISRNIPLFNDLDYALNNINAKILIIGAVSEGGILPKGYDVAIKKALNKGFDIVSGLHQFISDDPSFIKIANKKSCKIVDVRKIFLNMKRFYSGEIKKVKSKRIAIIGTDSAIGKRTIAVMINEALVKSGLKSDMIYTGQTGWMQGWPHGIVLDAMINDFVSGGIEGAILDSWNDLKPDYMIIEGQGSLVHPYFPGGYEILAAGKIDCFILVHAPRRKHLDGFPEYPMPNPSRVVKIAELITEKPLVGIGVNNENLSNFELDKIKIKLKKKFNVPVLNPIIDGVNEITSYIREIIG